MVNAHGEIVIARPPEAVFALLADPTRIPEWRPDILAATGLDGHGIGARYQETLSFMGKKTQTFEVIEHEPGRRLAVRAVDGLSLRPVQRYLLTNEAAGTRLRYEIELPVTGWFRMMGPMLRRMIPKKWEGYAAGIKTMLEG